MQNIDINITRENIHQKIWLLKNLVVDLELDLKQETDLKKKMDIYLNIVKVSNRINNLTNKEDRWKSSN